MEINFHYAAIKAIAFHAGFSKVESQTIAYASQYVDDANLYEELRLDKDPCVQGVRFDEEELIFDPICTAHKNLDYARAVTDRDSHRLVYVCFHFIPSLAKGEPHVARQTRKNCKVAKQLVRQAINALEKGDDKALRQRALVRLGVALHSYADTWSHQGFSGYWDWANNDISHIRKKARNGDWKPIDPVSSFLCYAAPDIGHAEAGTLPDKTDAAWDCVPPKTKQKRSNRDEFLAAAKAIFEHLAGVTGTAAKWGALERKLRKCFAAPADKDEFLPATKGAPSSWKKAFPGLGFSYDPEQWFDAALEPAKGILDVLGELIDIDPRDYQVKGGRDYFYFHAAAREQRKFVLDHAPKV